MEVPLTFLSFLGPRPICRITRRKAAIEHRPSRNTAHFLLNLIIISSSDACGSVSFRVYGFVKAKLLELYKFAAHLTIPITGAESCLVSTQRVSHV